MNASLRSLLLPAVLLLSACGPDAAEVALTHGDEALNQFQLAQAVEHYTDAIRLDPDLASAHLKRGQAHWMSRRFESAIDDLDRALELDPELGWAHFFRGSSHFALDSFDLALPDLAEAAASDDLPAEDRARAHRMRAVVFMITERYPEGIDALGEAIGFRPDLPLLYYERGLLYAETGQTSEARGDFERYLEMDTTAGETALDVRKRLDSL